MNEGHIGPFLHILEIFYVSYLLAVTLCIYSGFDYIQAIILAKN